MIIAILNFLRWFTWISKKTSDKHLSDNAIAWKAYYAKRLNEKIENIDKGKKSDMTQEFFSPQLVYIDNQNDLNFLQYGKYSKLWDSLFRKTGTPLTADFNSCEAIATMNALISLFIEKNAENFPKVLYYFERKHGLILGGYFGTAPEAIWSYLKSQKIKVRFCKLPEITDISKRKTYIVVLQNNRKSISDGIHTMCMQVDKGKIRLLNDYNGNRYYDSVWEALDNYNEGKSKVLKIAELS